jgi:hypothetical protein
VNIYIPTNILSIGLIKNVAAATTCNFCNGGTIDGNIEIPESGGVTCGILAASTALAEAGTEECTRLQMLEAFCCPSEIEGTPCSFCEGIEELSDTVISEGMTPCNDTSLYLPLFPDGSDECTSFKLFESVCCPSVATVPESPCSFCTGLDILENVSHLGTPCDAVLAVVGSIESTSEDCFTGQAYQAICCPKVPTVACSFCAAATSLTLGLVFQDTLTCLEVADYAAWLESTAEECTTTQEAEVICCPDVTSPNTPSATTSTISPPTSNAPPATEQTSSNTTSATIPTASLPATSNAPPGITPTPGQSTPPPPAASRYVTWVDC